MAESGNDTEGGFPLKLLVDEKQKKVIFAEAGKELVDFLFSLMLLPLGTVVSLVGKESAPGSMGKLYQSVINLDGSYMSGVPTTSADNVKAELISPGLHCSRLSQGALRLPWKSTCCTSTAPPSKILYKCSSNQHNTYLSEVCGANCPSCSYDPYRKMTQQVTLGQTSEVKNASDEGREKGFVKELVMYTITDDLSISPLSTISCLALIKGLRVNDLGTLQERTVMVGVKQGIKILETSLRSETVLSDVFL